MAMERLKEELISLTHRAGAQKTGFAAAHPVREESVDRFNSWLSEGKHGGMAYMKNYPDIRQNPRLLLNGINPEEPCTLMVCAFSYYHTERQTPDAARIAMYAHGSDYHEVLRQRLQPVLAHLDSLGIKGRICIRPSTRALLGRRGRNRVHRPQRTADSRWCRLICFPRHRHLQRPCLPRRTMPSQLPGMPPMPDSLPRPGHRR